jgi:hypothetical protein
MDAQGCGGGQEVSGACALPFYVRARMPQSQAHLNFGAQQAKRVQMPPLGQRSQRRRASAKRKRV